MKRTSVKVLLSAMIILLMIPFSFIKVNALNPRIYKVYSIYVTDGVRYDYVDYYFVAPNYCNGYFDLTVNNNFVFGSANVPSYSFGLVDSDGNASSLLTSSTSQPAGNNAGTAIKQTYRITLNECGYFHAQLALKTTTSWYPATDARTLTGKYGLVESDNITEYNVSTSEVHWLKQILYSINNMPTGGTIDLSEITDLLDEIIDLMDIQLGHLYDTNTKLDIIINQLNVQNGSPANDAVNNNDQANQEAEQIINDYDQLTSTFDSDFQDSQTEMTTILQNTSLTQFANSFTWFTNQLGLLYESLGDMKILVLLPLLLGIALFFIGRGAVIFRERDK